MKYICPKCKKEQTSILQWQTASICYEYDFYNGWEQKDIEGGDFESWNCPECGDEFQPSQKLIKKIF